MTMSRSRSVRTGLLTTLALATAFVVGCKGPAPVIPPAVPTAGGPVAPNNQTGAVEFNVVEGQALLGGKPLANASLQVVDALTDADASVVLEDGKAVPSAQAGLKTDGEGRFKAQVVGLTPGAVVRVVVTSESKTVSALVSGDGLKLRGMKVQATTFQTLVDEVSRAIDMVASGPLKLIARSLQGDAANTVSRDLIAKMQETADKLLAQAQANPEAAAALLALAEKPAAEQAAAVTEVLAKAGLANTLQDAVTDTLKAVAEKSQDPVNVAPGLTAEKLADVALVGTTLKVQTGTTGSLAVVNTATGQTVTTVSTTTSNPTPSNPTTPTTNTGGNGGTGNTVIPFNPLVPTLSYKSGALTIAISQTASDEDIEQVSARIASGSVEVDLNQMALATGVAEVGDDDFSFSVVPDPTATTEATFPSAWGTTSATLKWSGYLRTDGNVDIARFQVYSNDSYLYLVTNYLTDSAVSFTAAHTTTMHAPGVITSLTASSADIVLKSTKGNSKRINPATIAK